MRATQFCILVALFLATACSDSRRTDQIKSIATHPILKSWVVPISPGARIVSVSGPSFVLYKGTNKYVELHTGTSLAAEDLLLLKKDSQVTVQFQDGSRETIDPQSYPTQDSSEDFYFTIEEKH
jgi:hypothetical protein